jgi:hypothetical protein
VALAFPPNKRVGAMRAGYWYRSMGEALKGDVTVITAQKEASGDRVHVVPKSGTSWKTKFIPDEGVIWKKNIQAYLEKTEIATPSTVIITGGPFMHFSLTNWFKQKYGCKVILDYRDPFATNPGFNNSWIKTEVKCFFEKKFNRAADALVTVNSYCGKIIEYFDSKPNAIVQNGYDEGVACNPKPVELGEKVTFSYAGKFYFDPINLQEAFESCNVNIDYIGPDEGEWKLPSENINSLGFVDYTTAIEVIGGADVGIIQTYGHEFQSTTKIFDYLRCERAILIVSDDKIEEGSIHDELKGYPNVFWAKNEKQSIIDAIVKIKSETYSKPPEGFANSYSRGFQLGNMVKLIQELEA